MRKLNDFERGYIAGFLGNDGSLALRTESARRVLCARLTVASRNRDALIKLQGILGVGHVVRTSNPKCPGFQWTVSSLKELLAVVQTIQTCVPRMALRAMKVRTFCESRRQKPRGAPYDRNEWRIIEWFEKRRVTRKGMRRR